MIQILTTEQKTKLNDFMVKHEQRMMKHMQEQPQNQ